MTQNPSLDLIGNFSSHPLAELLVEIAQAKLSGSLRLSRESQKSVIYLNKGEVVYGVSNSKAMRLFTLLLRQKKITRETLADHPSFANDLEFSISLENAKVFTKEEIDAAVTSQVEAIVIDCLSWPDGDWHYSPLARLRADMRYPADLGKVLINYARCVQADIGINRFRSIKEAFSIDRERLSHVELQPHEMYVLGRFGENSLTFEQLRGMSSLPESGLLQALYVLWLGGLLQRHDWNAAFTPNKIYEIRSARMVRIKAAERVDRPVRSEPEPEAVPEVSEPLPTKAAELTIPLEEYLQRVEGAKTHYDTLGIADDADLDEIRRMYFGLAKLFHPDRYHRESETKLKRIQRAFTELSHAYETMKNSESRESYNFKMKKEIDARAKRAASGQGEATVADTRTETALQSFEQALNCLNDDDYEQAAVLLGRATHYSPDNAQFHAYYGFALSAFDKQQHKAEGEFQAAVRLDPKNPKIRMMLVEFFVEMNMTKRAIGELTRFLEIVPGNKEATRRLQKLTNN